MDAAGNNDVIVDPGALVTWLVRPAHDGAVGRVPDEDKLIKNSVGWSQDAKMKTAWQSNAGGKLLVPCAQDASAVANFGGVETHLPTAIKVVKVNAAAATHLRFYDDSSSKQSHHEPVAGSIAATLFM